MVDPGIAKAFRLFIRPDEKIMWTGRPRQGLIVRPIDFFAEPMTLIVTFGILGSIPIEVSRNSFSWDTYIGLMYFYIFILIVFLFPRFLIDAWLRSNIVYAITNIRAMMLRNPVDGELVTVKLGGKITFSSHSGGRGTLGFGRPVDAPYRFLAIYARLVPAFSNELEFREVGDAAEAYRLASQQT